MKARYLILLLPVAAVAVGYWGFRGQQVAGIESPAIGAAPADRIAPAAMATEEEAEPLAAASDEPRHDSGDETKRGCEWETLYMPAGDGTVFEVYSCESNVEKARHPYESYSSQSLELLAYSDAKAAEILGMRWRETNDARAMSLILRASALADGDIAPIILYSQAYPHPSAVDGVPVRKTLRTKYVLSAVADLLIEETYYAPAWAERIRQYSSNPDVEIARLDRRARAIVAEMRRIQLDVTGSSNIGGLGDA